MAFIQLSLKDIAGEVITGNALMDERCKVQCTSFHLFDRLCHWPPHPNPLAIEELSGQESRLLSVLPDEIDQAGSTPIMLPMPRDVLLRRTVERWLNSPDDQTGLDELATKAGMSRRAFTCNCKLTTGEWHQIARLMHGIDMLAAGKSVAKTALAITCV